MGTRIPSNETALSSFVRGVTDNILNMRMVVKKKVDEGDD